MTQPQGAIAAAPRRTTRHRIVKALRDLDRRAARYDRTRRLRDVIGEHQPWHDWGHRLMALVGRDDCGNWSPPRVRDLYFREVYDPSLRVITTRRAMDAWDGIKRGEEWRTFDSQDDGHTVRVGWLGSDGRLHDSGINGREEQHMFLRWFVWDGLVKAEWFGLRRWLYYKGLHAAVEQRYPFTCQIVPPERSGGYRHWHCHVRRPLFAILAGRRQQHDGPHRFGNYTWTEGDQRVEFAGQPS